MPEWIAASLVLNEGRDPLGLQTTTQDRLMPVLLPGILELTRRARYFSFHALHPLSGRVDATAFHLEAGRLCVLASRHRHACIMVARAGIQELLDAHPSAEPVHLNVAVKFPDGWEAQQALLAHLEQHRVVAT